MTSALLTGADRAERARTSRPLARPRITTFAAGGSVRTRVTTSKTRRPRRAAPLRPRDSCVGPQFRGLDPITNSCTRSTSVHGGVHVGPVEAHAQAVARAPRRESQELKLLGPAGAEATCRCSSRGIQGRRPAVRTGSASRSGIGAAYGMDCHLVRIRSARPC